METLNATTGQNLAVLIGAGLTLAGLLLLLIGAGAEWLRRKIDRLARGPRKNMNRLVGKESEMLML